MKHEIGGNKNEGESLAFSIAMAMQRYDAGCIVRWSTSRASLEATGCRYRASACTVSSRRLPCSTNSLKQHKRLTKHTFSQQLRYILSASCLWEFHTPNRTLYSAHRYDKLCLNGKHYNCSWIARGHFLLSNVVMGQKRKSYTGITKLDLTLTARGLEEHVRLSLIFAIVVSFM